MQFSEEEVQNLKEIFDLFDKQQVGTINIKDLEAIMQSLQRDPEEAKSLLMQIRQEIAENQEEGAPETDPETITFEDFLRMMEQVENNLAKDDPHNLNRQNFIRQSSQNGIINISADNKVLDFLRLLEEYRKKCEIEGNYQEAKKARGKFDELLRKETIRQKNNIRAA
jgi:Fe-S-cluster formation regulator IscX/YfhJ|tara:strand:+ start:253 stop:756 length:504 start_codon:yes stop_codon:yes gene_type:complete